MSVPNYSAIVDALRKTIPFFILATFWIPVLGAASLIANSPRSPTVLDDIVIFEREFIAKDNALSLSAKARVERMLNYLREKADSISPDQALMHFSAITALADNAGSLLLADNQGKPRPRMPFRSAWFENRLYILRAHSTHPDIVGSEILSVEGKSMAQLVSALDRYRGGLPSRRRSAMPMFIENPSLLHAVGLSERPDRLKLRLRMRTGRINSLTIASALPLPITFWPDRLSPEGFPGAESDWEHAISASKLPLYLQDFETPRRIVSLPQQRALFVQIKWTPSARTEPLETFKSAFEQEMQESPEALVVDLRFDHGGSTPELVGYLRSAIADYAGKGGKVAVLIGPITHESGIVLAAAIKSAGKSSAILIGEAPGDRLQFWASGGRSCLPFSGSCAIWADRRFDVKNGCRDVSCEVAYSGLHIASLEPDIRVRSTWQGYMGGCDHVLEAALLNLPSRSSQKYNCLKL